uniref:Uncharacterized protein n=1 Tax=Anguilla anguilla TaxID=7936 RepID=A0A0E9URI2_ANGAN
MNPFVVFMGEESRICWKLPDLWLPVEDRPSDPASVLQPINVSAAYWRGVGCANEPIATAPQNARMSGCSNTVKYSDGQTIRPSSAFNTSGCTNNRTNELKNTD